MDTTPLRMAFRVDASLQMGTGHVMRCLTLADAFKSAGHACHFICRAHPGHLADLIRQRGHEVHLLASRSTEFTLSEKSLPKHAHWLGAGMSEDAIETHAVLTALQPRWLVVDHYALDARWERIQRELVQHILVIDDLADRTHHADLLLDQNLGKTEADHRIHLPSTTRVLMGPMHALLRPEFASLRVKSLAKRPSKALRQIVVSLGGVDKDNATGQILDALSKTQLPDETDVTIVMGGHAPWLPQVHARAESLRFRTHVVVNATNMAELMARSDLAIGAAGSTSWERCCLGVPTLMVVLADNQRTAAASLEALGATWSLNLGPSLPDQLSQQIQDLQRHECRALANMSNRAAAVTDGQGTDRVISAMQQFSDESPT